MNYLVPHIESKKIEEVNKFIKQIAPHLQHFIKLVRECNMHEFDIMVGDGSDKISWNDGQVLAKSPTEEQLKIELVHILDLHYPPNGVFSFMGMIWNPNIAVAEKMAKVVSEYRKLDRKGIENQIIALLTAFKTGS